MVCHPVSGKSVGPAFAEIAARPCRELDGKALARLPVAHVTGGGV
jgi:hypothetical protein